MSTADDSVSVRHASNSRLQQRNQELENDTSYLKGSVAVTQQSVAILENIISQLHACILQLEFANVTTCFKLKTMENDTRNANLTAAAQLNAAKLAHAASMLELQELRHAHVLLIASETDMHKRNTAAIHFATVVSADVEAATTEVGRLQLQNDTLRAELAANAASTRETEDLLYMERLASSNMLKDLQEQHASMQMQTTVATQFVVDITAEVEAATSEIGDLQEHVDALRAQLACANLAANALLHSERLAPSACADELHGLLCKERLASSALRRELEELRHTHTLLFRENVTVYTQNMAAAKLAAKALAVVDTTTEEVRELQDEIDDTMRFLDDSLCTLLQKFHSSIDDARERTKGAREEHNVLFAKYKALQYKYDATLDRLKRSKMTSSSLNIQLNKAKRTVSAREQMMDDMEIRFSFGEKTLPLTTASDTKCVCSALGCHTVTCET